MQMLTENNILIPKLPEIQPFVLSDYPHIYYEGLE